MFGRERSSGERRPAPEIITALDNEQVISLLRDHGIRYFIDDDDVGAFWDGVRIYFTVGGEHREMFFMRSYFDRRLSADDRVAILALIDEWNRERLFPKVYTSLDDQGALRLMGEMTIDCEAGVTRAYLSHMIGAAVATAMQFVEFLDKRV